MTLAVGSGPLRCNFDSRESARCICRLLLLHTPRSFRGSLSFIF
jgi:hypothetical protein